MLSPTYTSVKNANLVDCGKKPHFASQPSTLLRDNYLGEYRTELDKRKVLANLGIATDLSLEWEYIKGDIGRSEALMGELDSRTKYISELDGFQKTLIEGVTYLETVVGGEQEAEAKQDKRLTDLETFTEELSDSLDELKTYLEDTIEVDIDKLEEDLLAITEKVDNITELIKVSSKPGNALSLIVAELATHIWDATLNEGEGGYREVFEGETATHVFDGSIYREPILDSETGLYVPDLSQEVTDATENIGKLQEDVKTINDSLESFVTREELGGGDFDFVDLDDFDNYTEATDEKISDIEEELDKTVKTGEDGHVNTLFVNSISKETEGTIKLTDSFEVESGIPLDVRFVVKTLEELHSLKPLVCYAGMGVIVSDQASLYILREPANGVIDEEYIRDKDGLNWKCPEDLIIEVLTQEEYDAKVESDSINPNMFYYIHEEVTEEPQRKDFESDELYAEALDKWLRVLQQKYMSAVWGQEIETLVANKASNESVKALESEIQRLGVLIDSLSGGSSGVNLKDLDKQVAQNTSNLETLIKEDGTIPTLLKDLESLQTTVTSDYVTKESITVEDPNTEYIFVKKSAFDTYVDTHNAAIAEQVTTNKLVLGEDTLETSESELLFNSEKVALNKQIPVIDLVDYAEFKDQTEFDENKYYYVFNDEERYVLDSEYSEYKSYQSEALRGLSESIQINSSAIGTLANLSTENKINLVYAINEVKAYAAQLSFNQDLLLAEEGIIAIIQKELAGVNEKLKEYVKVTDITVEDPNVDYIFVKQSVFDSYKTTTELALAKEVVTDKVTTNTTVIGNHTLTSIDSDLLVNDEVIALGKDIPVIEVMDKATFDASEKDSETYYYVYDETDRYILDSEFTTYKNSQSTIISTLSQDTSKNKTEIGDLTTLNTANKSTLVFAINELVTKINDLTLELNALKEIVNSSTTE